MQWIIFYVSATIVSNVTGKAAVNFGVGEGIKTSIRHLADVKLLPKACVRIITKTYTKRYPDYTSTYLEVTEGLLKRIGTLQKELGKKFFPAVI